METWIYLAIGWVVCGVAGYLVTRFVVRRDGEWTEGDRAAAILFCAFLSPLWLLFCLAAVACEKLKLNSDRPASW